MSKYAAQQALLPSRDHRERSAAMPSVTAIAEVLVRELIAERSSGVVLHLA